MSMMNREQFLVWLRASVNEKWITVQQAATMLLRFEAGKITKHDLPLPREEAITDITEDEVVKAIVKLKEELG